MSTSRFIHKVLAELPAPGTDAMDHARHTLAAMVDSADTSHVITATYGVYGDGVTTGLTWGDLRELVRRLELVERHLRPNWARTACGSTDGDGSICPLPVNHDGPHDDGLAWLG